MISDSREVEKGGCDHPVQVNQYINELKKTLRYGPVSIIISSNIS
jgi:hypothetical protein